MAKINDGMRGKWGFGGQHWFCDCYRHEPLLNVHFGQGGSRTGGRSHSPNVSRCNRCHVLRPLKRDRPEFSDGLPHNIKRAIYKDGRLHEVDVVADR